MSHVLTRLDKRRHELGMSMPALSKRCGVSVPTLSRTLSGKNPNASFATIESIANALEIELICQVTKPAIDVLESAARQKANKLVSMSQATAGLEMQAVPNSHLEELQRKTTHLLMAGSKRKLWND